MIKLKGYKIKKYENMKNDFTLVQGLNNFFKLTNWYHMTAWSDVSP